MYNQVSTLQSVIFNFKSMFAEAKQTIKLFLSFRTFILKYFLAVAADISL